MSTIVMENATALSEPTTVTIMPDSPTDENEPVPIEEDNQDNENSNTSLTNINGGQSVVSSRKDLSTMNSHMFTYKPKLNPKSQEIAKNILDFYERQNQHSKKQLEILEEAYNMATNDYGKLLYSTTYASSDPNNFFSNNFNQKKVTKLTKMRKTSLQLENIDEDENKAASQRIELGETKPNSAEERPFERNSINNRIAFTRSKSVIYLPNTSSASTPSLSTSFTEKKRSAQKRFTMPSIYPLKDEAGTAEEAVNDDAKDETVTTHASHAISQQQPAPHPKPRKTIQVDESLKLSRSKTMPPSSSPPAAKKEFQPPAKSTMTINKDLNSDRLKMAKEEAERAIKSKKIFTIIGPYPSLRESLRNRGWVEKFENINPLPALKKKAANGKKKSMDQSMDDDKDGGGDDGADDNDDNDDEAEEEDRIKPWEENNGYYGIISRMVKSFASTLIWTVRSGYVDYAYLNKDQMINHYNKNGAFTTKIGLCTNLKNLSWYSEQTAEDFFPRCFKLSHEEDKAAFIEDYRLTSCISLLKYIMIKHRGEPEGDIDVHITSAEELKKYTDQIETVSPTADPTSNLNISPIGSTQLNSLNANTSTSTANTTSASNNLNSNTTPRPTQSFASPRASLSLAKQQQQTSVNRRKTKLSVVPIEAVQFAIERLRDYVDFRQNNDLDKPEQIPISDERWSKFYEWFYAACHDKVSIETLSDSQISDVAKTLDEVKQYWPQFNIDGFRNIWIVKPGALSRGRGIIVFDKIENILELNTSPLQRDGKYVVQKYIERPLLIHNIKFDIRQWFLVTDFNPLTIWMYKDCYLRFCTQKFTLENTQQSVHLCNYSIQKYYKNDTERNAELPEENMWSSQDFIENHLTRVGKREAWEELIYPGMKNAIMCSMLSTQDIIEPRKNTFELYGADFMIGEDLKPWLIEINCSPTMARSTVVTTHLCDSVQEDVCKVVIDRKTNKNCDIGRFELLYKAPPVPAPNYIGIDLKVDGHSCKKPQLPMQPNGQPSAQQQQQQLLNSNYTTVNFTNNTINIASKSTENIESAATGRHNQSNKSQHPHTANNAHNGGTSSANSNSSAGSSGSNKNNKTTSSNNNIKQDDDSSTNNNYVGTILTSQLNNPRLRDITMRRENTSIGTISIGDSIQELTKKTAHFTNKSFSTVNGSMPLSESTTQTQHQPLTTSNHHRSRRGENTNHNVVVKQPKVFQFEHPYPQLNTNNYSRALIERSSYDAASNLHNLNSLNIKTSTIFNPNGVGSGGGGNHHNNGSHSSNVHHNNNNHNQLSSSTNPNADFNKGNSDTHATATIGGGINNILNPLVPKTKIVYKPSLTTATAFNYITDGSGTTYPLTAATALGQGGSPDLGINLLKCEHKKAVSEFKKPLLASQLKEKIVQTVATGTAVAGANLANLGKPPLPPLTVLTHTGLTRVQVGDLADLNEASYSSFANRSLIINKNGAGENEVPSFKGNFLTNSASFVLDNPNGTLLTCKDNRFYVDRNMSDQASLLADVGNKVMVKVSPQLLILNLSKKRLSFDRPINI